ncbi:MAG: DUF2272 domain-containing protein [Burkholderiales bacterium]
MPAAAPPPAPTLPRGNALAICTDSAERVAAPPRALAMARAARGEHLAWGGQAMDEQGRLIRSGSAEAENASRRFGAASPWQRVLDYWRAVDPQGRLPSVLRFGLAGRADRAAIQQQLAERFPARVIEPGADGGAGAGPDASVRQALLAAVDRAAVVDTPWSAAFISWLARAADLRAGEFAFSEAHADYAAAAWAASADEVAGRATRHALRACDALATPPRIGDLLCQSRGRDAGLDSFERLGAALADRLEQRGGALAMHCDVVVAVDESAFETIGGNVLQSVTSRPMAFAPGRHVLDPSYSTQRCPDATRPGCAPRHLSHQPWSMLLQWR